MTQRSAGTREGSNALRGGSARGEGLRTTGGVFCGVGFFFLARGLGRGFYPFATFISLDLLLLAIGVPLLLLGSLLRRFAKPAWSWQPSPYPAMRRRPLPLWVAAFVAPALLGLGLGLTDRLRAEHAKSERRDAVQAAIDAQAREGRPLDLAVRECSDIALGLHLPSQLPTSKRAFADTVTACVLERPESDNYQFRCHPETYTCFMAVHTARVDYGDPQDSPTYGVDFADALDEFLGGP